MSHISHSALMTWNKCPYSYKLHYIDHSPIESDSIHTVFGSSIHKTCEKLLLKEQIEPILSTIMYDLETSIGIHFNSKPRIEYDLPFLSKVGSRNETQGVYVPATETIHINAMGVMVPNLFLDLLTCYGQCFSAVDTFKHELGHFYVDQVATEEKQYEWSTISKTANILVAICDQNWMLGEWSEWKFENHPLVQKIKGQDIVNEGIGEYFSKGPIPEDGCEFGGTNPYQLGHCLVTPIIDRFHKEGIDYLIKHPPLSTHNLTKYQQDALIHLEQSKRTTPASHQNL